MILCPIEQKVSRALLNCGQLDGAEAWLSDPRQRALTPEPSLPEALDRSGKFKPLACLELIHSVFISLWCTWALWGTQHEVWPGVSQSDLSWENRPSGQDWPESCSLIPTCPVSGIRSWILTFFAKMLKKADYKMHTSFVVTLFNVIRVIHASPAYDHLVV